VSALHVLESGGDRSGQSAGATGRDHRRRWGGAHAAGENQPSDRAASRRHCLSREEHDFLFSAGDFDFNQRGAFDFAVRSWEDEAVTQQLAISN
jgi:hypothetical protein